MTRTIKEGLTMVASQNEGVDGDPQPQIEVQVPYNTNWRVAHAELLELAIELELTTPACERWYVRVEPDHSFGWVAGRVYLELFHATTDEAARAMKFLNKAVARLTRRVS